MRDSALSQVGGEICKMPSGSSLPSGEMPPTPQGKDQHRLQSRSAGGGPVPRARPRPGCLKALHIPGSIRAVLRPPDVCWDLGTQWGDTHIIGSISSKVSHAQVET